MKQIQYLGVAALTLLGVSQAATIFTPTAAVSVTDDGSATDVGSVNVSPMTGDYFIRERRATGQSDRQISSFFQFDVSSLTVSEVTAPGFTASFQIDYVAQLNNLTPSNAAPAIVGRVVSGDGWDLSGTDFPLHDWGFDEGTNSTTAQNTQTLIADIPGLNPTVNDLEVDMTAVVQGWVDGSFDNYGLVLFIDKLEAQGAGFSNPELVIDVVPEPSSLALAGLGLLGFVTRRRR